MGTTPKGYPYPDLTDPPNGPLQFAALALTVDANPGVALLTYTQINALAGADLWHGRVVYQIDTGTARPREGLYTYNGIYWSLPWGQSWGYVTEVQSAGSGGTGITAQADLTGMSLTFTALANRRYRFEIEQRLSKDSTAGDSAVYVTTAGNTVLWQRRQNLASSGVLTFRYSYRETGLTGSITRKLRAESFTGAVNATEDAVGHNYLAVYDDGPTGVPA